MATAPRSHHRGRRLLKRPPLAGQDGLGNERFRRRTNAKAFCNTPTLRRFYCAADYGRSRRSTHLTRQSKKVVDTARTCGFEVVSKRLKYIADPNQPSGHLAKCDQDADIVTALLQHRDAFDRIVLFSEGGDFVPALTRLHEAWGKESVVIAALSARAHETVDAHAAGTISAVICADDLKQQLDD